MAPNEERRMNQAIPAKAPTAEPSAEILWRTWFEEAMTALNDVLKRSRESSCTSALCPPDRENRKRLHNARKWFTAANDQAEHLKDATVRLGEGQAGLSWTLLHLLDTDKAAALAAQALGNLPRFDGEDSSLSHRRLRSWCHYVLGEAAFRTNRITDGLKHLRRALPLMPRTPENELLIVDAIERIGLLEAKRSNYKSAAQYFATAIRLLGRDNGPPVRIAVLWANLCSAKIEQGEYRAANRVYRQWTELEPGSIEGNVEFSRQSRIFGYMLILNGNYEDARRLLTQAASSALSAEEHAGKLAQHRSYLYTQLGEYQAAIEQLEKIPVATSGDQRKLRDWLIHGQINIAFGDFTSAMKCYAAGEEMIDGGANANTRDRLLILVGKAEVLIAKGYNKMGGEYALNAIRFLEREARFAQPEMALALHQLARSSLRRDQRREAAPLCDRSREVLAMAIGAEHPRMVEILLTRSEIHWGLSELEEAAVCCDQAEKILLASRPRDLFAAARIGTMRARLAHAGKDFSAARMWLEEAWQAWETQEAVVDCEHPEKGYTILVAASLFVRLGDLREADRVYALAESLFGESAEHNLLRVAYEVNRLGTIYYQLGLHPEAKWMFEHALKHYRERFGTRHSHVVRIQDNIRATDEAMAPKQGPASRTFENDPERRNAM